MKRKEREREREKRGPFLVRVSHPEIRKRAGDEGKVYVCVYVCVCVCVFDCKREGEKERTRGKSVVFRFSSEAVCELWEERDGVCVCVCVCVRMCVASVWLVCG